MVGAEGFEPPTPWSQTRCATKLRYAPYQRDEIYLNKYLPFGQGFFTNIFIKLITIIIVIFVLLRNNLIYIRFILLR